MRIFGLSDVGAVRERNEDALFYDQTLLAVADGMGGHLAGDVASSTAVQLLERSKPKKRAADPEGFIKTVIADANNRIFKRSTKDKTMTGMGTTITMGLIAENRLIIGHVGDSRAYLWRDGELRQLTTDHSLVAELVASGQLTPEEAEHHPRRSIITRALGVDPTVDVDIVKEGLFSHDRLLFCSDGLNTVLSEEDICKMMSVAADPEDACRRLVKATLEGGAPDNITVIVAYIDPAPAAPA